MTDHYSKQLLLAEASALDAGITADLLAGQITILDRFAHDDLPGARAELFRMRSR